MHAPERWRSILCVRKVLFFVATETTISPKLYYNIPMIPTYKHWKKGVMLQLSPLRKWHVERVTGETFRFKGRSLHLESHESNLTGASQDWDRITIVGWKGSKVPSKRNTSLVKIVWARDLIFPSTSNQMDLHENRGSGWYVGNYPCLKIKPLRVQLDQRWQPRKLKYGPYGK